MFLVYSNIYNDNSWLAKTAWDITIVTSSRCLHCPIWKPLMTNIFWEDFLSFRSTHPPSQLVSLATEFGSTWLQRVLRSNGALDYLAHPPGLAVENDWKNSRDSQGYTNPENHTTGVSKNTAYKKVSFITLWGFIGSWFVVLQMILISVIASKIKALHAWQDLSCLATGQWRTKGFNGGAKVARHKWIL